MAFQSDPAAVRWRLHLNSPIANVFAMLATAEGRARFWAESAEERRGVIQFEFPNGFRWESRVLEVSDPHRYSIEYIDNSVVTFTLQADGEGGTELEVAETGVAAVDRTEIIAGWVSVLMALKAAVDYDVDLRAHDQARTWETGYVEN